jgi:hypothetical protein
MKNLIDTLNQQWSDMEILDAKISALENFIETMTRVGEKLITAEKDLVSLRAEKTELSGKLLSTSSQITKLLYDGNI